MLFCRFIKSFKREHLLGPQALGVDQWMDGSGHVPLEITSGILPAPVTNLAKEEFPTLAGGGDGH